jgi:flagella basal body P-ring formation protein FlgA
VRGHHIIGLDTRGLAEVTVARASRAITAKDVEARIVRALAGQSGATDPRNLAVTFDREVRTLHVEPSAGAELAVIRQSFDSRTGRFDLFLDVPGGTTGRRALRFTGSLAETVETAVVTRALAQGDVVKASDIAIERRPKADFPTGALVALDQAVGFAAKRALRVGQALRPSDLVKPELVGRNETVTIVYEVPGIVLTMRGKALEAGAEGDLINVLNVQTNRTIQGTVNGPGSVTAVAAGPRLAADGGASNRRRAE